MAKILISTSAAQKTASVSAVANSYLMADGLLNFDAVAKLQAKVAAALKGTEGKLAGTYVIKRRAKPVKYSAALEKKRDHKYLAARAIKVVLRKRVTPESLARVAVLLQVPAEVDAKLNAEFKKAHTAIARHVKKCETVLGKVTTEKGKIRDAKNANYDKSISLLTPKLVEAGIKDSDIVESQGMMGKTVIVKVGPDNYVSITHADKTRFAAAKKGVTAPAAAPAKKAPVRTRPAAKAPAAKKTIRVSRAK